MEVNENNDKKLNFLNKEELVSALEESNYYVSIAARKLGVNRSSVYKYMAIYGIPKSGVCYSKRDANEQAQRWLAIEERKINEND